MAFKSQGLMCKCYECLASSSTQKDKPAASVTGKKAAHFYTVGNCKQLQQLNASFTAHSAQQLYILYLADSLTLTCDATMHVLARLQTDKSSHNSDTTTNKLRCCACVNCVRRSSLQTAFCVYYQASHHFQYGLCINCITIKPRAAFIVTVYYTC